MDSLLLHCGYAVEPTLLVTIEQLLSKSLLCMMKGIFENKSNNTRKLQRVSCEILRQDVRYQEIILGISLTFICTCHVNGNLSGIIPILRKCSENGLHMFTLRTQCVRILTILDTILMPTAIAIPSSSVYMQLRDEILETTTTPSLGK
jgi:hypothetical protein